MLKRPVVTTLWQIAGKMVTVVISLVTVRWLTKSLGVAGYGNFTLITSSFLLFDAIADLGTRMVGVRELSQKENEDWPKIWQHLLWFRLILTTVAFGGGLIFCFIYSGFNGIRSEAVVALLLSWGTMVAGNLEIVWQWKLKLNIKAIIDVLFPLFFLIWFWLWRDQQTLLMVMIGYLVARMVSVAIGIVWTLPYWRLKKYQISFDKKLLVKLAKEAWPVGLYLLIFTSYDRAIDSLLIRHFMGSKEVAWYGLAYKIYGNLIMPAYYFVSSIFPLLSNALNRKETIAKGKWFLMAMVLLGAPFIYFLAPLAIQVLGGSDFEPSVGVLRILIGALFFAYLNHLFGFGLVGEGSQKKLLIIGITVLIFNAVANVLAIPSGGIYAAAWVTVASEGLMLMLLRIL